MRTIQQLRAAGFTVQPATDAVECTEVLSAAPFWYYNLNFCTTMSEVNEALSMANAHNNGYRLLVAGVHAEDVSFPFNILDETRKGHLDEARARYQTGHNEMVRGEADYHDALRTDEAYLA